MSYSIVFQTKMLDLEDGRIIHFFRSGCNNDDRGRIKDVFNAEIKSKEEIKKQAIEYMDNSKPYKESGSFELKIGNRPCSFYDYGKHLLRVLKRSETVKEFSDNYTVSAKVFKGIEIIEPFHEVITRKENPNIINDFFFRKGRFSGNHKSIRFRYMREYIYDIPGIVEAINNEEEVEIEIKRRKK